MNEEQYINELTKCIHCGTCKAYCSTYESDSEESLGARGRLALLYGLNKGQLIPSNSICEKIFSCTLCGACSPQCPLGIDIKEIIYKGRIILRKHDSSRKLLRFISKFFINHPLISFRFLNLSQHVFLPYLNKKDILPFKLTIPEHRLKDKLQVVTVPQKKGRVAIFTGCTTNFLYPYLGKSLINVLRILGYEIILPRGEVCCGTPLRALGMEKEAIWLAEKNYELFTKLNVQAVLSLCPTCTLALKSEYPKMIGKGIDYSYDISEFLLDRLYFTEKMENIPYSRVIYHDPCHLKYGLGVTNEPREILRKAGIDLIKTKESKCCGFAGTFCFSNKSLSKNMLETCINYYNRYEFETLVTSCPGCILYLSQKVTNKKVVHLIEVIESMFYKKSQAL
ncbi:MAG: (Fe-S)-binding protein [Nitrospirae bacterium]|jgi:glycolate oxidase iron-sulfur subunit|nr:(Fe-S)-binding protein [Nitrospirota bacterium]